MGTRRQFSREFNLEAVRLFSSDLSFGPAPRFFVWCYAPMLSRPRVDGGAG